MIDYISEIRQHFKIGEKPQLDTSREKYFDSVTFWQQAYEKSEAAQSKLLDRIYDLEQRNEALLSRLKPMGPEPLVSSKQTTNRTASTVRKGAKTNNDSINCHCDAKQIPTGIPPSILGTFDYKEEGALTIHSGVFSGCLCERRLISILLLEAVTAPLMRHLFVLQQSLQKKHNFTGIVSAAVDYCKSAEKAILATVRERTALNNRPKTTIVLYYRQPASLSVLSALECTHPLLYQATNKILNLPKPGKIVGGWNIT